MAHAGLHLEPLWGADFQSAADRLRWAKNSPGLFSRAAAVSLTHLLSLITRLHRILESGSRLQVLQALVAHYGVGEHPNWLEALHSKMMETVPLPLLQLYPHDVQPTEHEFKVMTAVAHDPGAEPVGRADLYQRVLRPWRERGHVVVCRPMRHYQVLIQGVIEHTVGFAIPTREALDVIVKHASPRGIVEMGAGTGYWAAMLKDHGADVLAFDRDPPQDDQSNPFFGAGLYTHVRRGDATSLFRESAAWPAEAPEALYARTLLLIWPNNPDLFDNAHLVAAPERAARQNSSAATRPWDADCLSTFIAAGGESVVYVGEREETVRQLLSMPGAQPDCGLSASRKFQSMLHEHFVLVERVCLPSWWRYADDLTVWQRRRRRDHASRNPGVEVC